MQERFALHWDAHGQRYGIPIEIDAAVRAHKCVIFNASRTIVPIARARYESAAVALIYAPPEIKAQRLANRAREGNDGISARLARRIAFAPQTPTLRSIIQGHWSRPLPHSWIGYGTVHHSRKLTDGHTMQCPRLRIAFNRRMHIRVCQAR